MKISDDSLRQLRATFVGEAEEQLRAISGLCLALESEIPAHAQGWPPGDARLADIFRQAHSLKGASRAMGMPGIEALSHRLETLFGYLQDGSVRPSAELFDVVYQALDAIAALVRDCSGEAGAVVDVASLSQCLDLLATGERLPGAPDAASSVVLPGQNRPDSLPDAATRFLPAVPPPPLLPTEKAGVDEQTSASAGQTGRPAAKFAAWPAGSRAGLTAAAVPAKTTQSALGDETVRVSISKLDALMAQVGELQVTRIDTERRLAQVDALLESLESWDQEARKSGAAALAGNVLRVGGNLGRFLERNQERIKATRGALENLRRQYEMDGRRLAQVLRDLQDDVRRTRMLPISVVFEAFPRMVRDLAHSLGKEVDLAIAGGDTELDRSILQQIKAPLTHLLRNAVDHGIEMPEARVQAGKPRRGTVTLSAVQRGDSLIVEVHDDGAGVNLNQVRSAAVQKGLVTTDVAKDLTDREATWLIFRPGFSTSAQTTDISGRGIGLDVVRENIERMRGMIDVETQLKQGTRFTLTLPLTVATTQCLLIGCGGHLFALPTNNVVRITHCSPATIGHVKGREAISIDGRAVLLMRLAEVLGMAATQAGGPLALGLPRTNPAKATLPVVILRVADKQVAFLVDELAGVQEVVIKGLPPPLMRVRYAAGATILGAGEVIVVLNVADLVRSVEYTGIRPDRELQADAVPGKQMPGVLVADDSITTRTLERSILETAGYRVQAVADGEAAWQALAGSDFDLLVSDVSMPQLDGFELTRRIRGDARLKDLPVVLVTSLDDQKDRERGVQAGADAYILKGTFDQESFLATVARLIL